MFPSPSHRLFITLDVVFHEDIIYFSKPTFQGKYQKEIQILDYDESDSQNVHNIDVSGITLEYTVHDSQTLTEPQNE